MSKIEIQAQFQDTEPAADIDRMFEAMCADAELVHELRMSADSEWVVLEAASRFLRHRTGRLQRIRVTRSETEGVSLSLQLAGLGAGEARMLVALLAAAGGVSCVRLEYVMMRKPSRD